MPFLLKSLQFLSQPARLQTMTLRYALVYRGSRAWISRALTLQRKIRDCPHPIISCTLSVASFFLRHLFIHVHYAAICINVNFKRLTTEKTYANT